MADHLPDLMQGGAVPDWARYKPHEDTQELTANAGNPMGVLSIRGKVWRLRYRGDEQIVTDPATNEPMPYLDLVLVGGNKNLSKIYYEKAYVEGSDEAPACMSVNGDAPDPGVPDRQNPTCPDCRWNAWGSRVTPQGNKTKACQDSRRIAVVPAVDLRNEAYGGPVLLRVPPASLGALAEYDNLLKQKYNVAFYAVVTRISFDTSKAYPQLAFRPIRLLGQDDVEIVKELRAGDVIQRVLSVPVELTPDARVPNPTSDNLGEMAAGGQGVPEPVKQAAAKPAPVKATVTEAPAPQPERPVGFAPPPKKGNGTAEAPTPAKQTAPKPVKQAAAKPAPAPAPVVEAEPAVEEAGETGEDENDIFKSFISTLDAELNDIP
jgi:hypothetical protein